MVPLHMAALLGMERFSSWCPSSNHARKHSSHARVLSKRRGSIFAFADFFTDAHHYEKDIFLNRIARSANIAR